MTAQYDGTLLSQHKRLLGASSIDPEVATERGYATVDRKVTLAKLGIKSAAVQVPGLLIPVHNVAGEVAFCQYRPDVPRVVNGKERKYEQPFQAAMVVDVPPRVRDQLGDPVVPLFVTEGARKADAAVSKGLCCVSLLGVFNFRGRNGKGGYTALSCWESVALKGRIIYVAYDSDVMVKAAVHQACERFGAFLAGRGADVRFVYLPSPNGSKVGLDDYLAAGHTTDELVQLARADLLKPAGEKPQTTPRPTRRAADVPAQDGAQLLDEVHEWLGSYVAFPSDHAHRATTLWTAHTHLMDCWESTPRLAALSPEAGSGKTRLLEVLELVCPLPMMSAGTSTAALFRSMVDRPTVLLDEIDAVFGAKTKGEHEDLRALINAGHRRRGRVHRVVGDGANMHPEAFPAYGAMALAGLGKLPATLADRSVILRMRRRSPKKEPLRSFRARFAEPEGAALRERLERWAEQASDRCAEHFPTMPAGVTDRPADAWEALVTVADVAGGRWPVAARAACQHLVAGAAGADNVTIGVRLLVDLRDIFADIGDPVIPTETLLSRLHDIEEAPWGAMPRSGKPMDARKLAAWLRGHDNGQGEPITPHVTRIGDKTPRGYRAADLADAWDRYVSGPTPLGNGVYLSQPQHPRSEGIESVAPTDGSAATTATPPSHVAVVADTGPTPQRKTRALTSHVAAKTAKGPFPEGGTPRNDDAPRCVVCDDPVPLPADGPAPLKCATCEVAS